jgi:hypothetical protein
VELEMSSRMRTRKEDAHTHESGCAWLAVILLVVVLTKASGSIPLAPPKLAILPNGEIGKCVNCLAGAL